MSRTHLGYRPLDSLRFFAVVAATVLLVGCSAPAAPAVQATQPPAATAAAAPTVEPMPTQKPTVEATAVPATPAPQPTADVATPEMTVEGGTPAGTEASATPAAAGGGEATPSQPAQTAGQLAKAGAAVYGGSCAGCHGPEGTGGGSPELVGPVAKAGFADRFGTAAAMLNFIHKAMPMTSPGSLTEEQALEVSAHLLLKNGWVTEDTPLSIEQLDKITLK